MYGIDFRTVAGIAAFGFLALGLGFYLAAGKERRGRDYGFYLAGVALVAASGLIELINWGSRELTVILSYAGVAGTVGGTAFLLAGAKRSLGIGVAPAWYLGVAGLDSLALLIFRLGFPGYRGLRTVAFSGGVLLLIIPVLVKSCAYVGSIWGVFRSGLVLASAGSTIRLVFAVLDLSRDDYVPSRVDAWLYFSIVAAGMCSGAALVAGYARKRFASSARFIERRKPPLSLADRGLSAKETLYLLEVLAGRSSKEIACQHGVADSTVRNSLARAYRKLGSVDKVGVIALAGEYDIVP